METRLPAEAGLGRGGGRDPSEVLRRELGRGGGDPVRPRSQWTGIRVNCRVGLFCWAGETMFVGLGFVFVEILWLPSWGTPFSGTRQSHLMM